MIFDEHMTSPVRLSILSCLVPGEALTFTELKRESGVTDGNLHVQTRKLATAGYIEIVQIARGARTLTRFRITELGLESLRLHVRKLQAIMATEIRPVRLRPNSPRDDDSQVWS